MDQPTSGLDPGDRNCLYNLLSEIDEWVRVIPYAKPSDFSRYCFVYRGLMQLGYFVDQKKIR